MSEAAAVLPAENGIRRATPDDIPAVAALGIEALECEGYPGMLIDREKVYNMTRECISSGGNFCWVSVEDGVVVGSLGAYVHECLFYERKQASVVQYYCKGEHAGLRLVWLMRTFLQWARGRRAVKMIVFALEQRADPRIGRILTRMGLNCELPIYMEVR